MASTPLKEVLLVGFGAVGAIYSHILKRSGLARVTVVARSNYELVLREGIHLKSKKYGDIPRWKPDRVCQSVSSAADQAYDYVVLTTKAVPDVIKTSTILFPLLSSPYAERFRQPTYVLLQNGLNVEKDLYQALETLNRERPRIVSTALYIGTNLVAPNVVEHNHFDRISIGWYRPNDFTTTTNSTEELTVLKDIGNILEKGGSTIEIVPEIQRVKFKKNFWNLAFSSWSTITSYTVPSLFRAPPTETTGKYEPYVAPMTAELIDDYTIPAIKATLQELVELARVLGFPDSEEGIPSGLPDKTIELTRALHVTPDSSHKASMLLDAEKDQPIEVEVILGEVVRMARERDVAVPRVETLYGLLLVIQNQILRKMESRGS